MLEAKDKLKAITQHKTYVYNPIDTAQLVVINAKSAYELRYSKTLSDFVKTSIKS